MFLWFEGAIYTGTIPGIAIAFLTIETLILLWLYRTQRVSLLIVSNALAGGAVMVGVYLLATGGSALLVAILLVTSLIAHFFDLAARRRLIVEGRRRDSSTTPAN